MFTLPKKTIMLPKLPDVIYTPNFLTSEKASEVLAQLLKDVDVKSETYVFNDNEIQTKRKIAYFSEKAYTYSNQSYEGRSWHPLLLALKEEIEKATGYQFNAVLVNHYSDGEAGMGWHADKEKELGSQPIIASLSLGQARRFAFRHRKDVVNMKNPPRLVEYLLSSGDLLIMKGDTQAYFEHCVVKDKSANGIRINLTFRLVIA